MGTITTSIQRNSRIAIVDFTILVIVYLIPSLSHLLGFPLYLLDPMRCMVLGSLLFLGNKKNSFLLAITLPLFSFILSGHPIVIKNALIAIELVTNLTLFFLFVSKHLNEGISMFLSIVLSKFLYYGLKYMCIISGLLSVELLSTSLVLQFIVAIVISFAFYLWYKKRKDLLCL